MSCGVSVPDTGTRLFCFGGYMDSLISAIRSVIGVPSFFHAGVWDFNLMIEYFVAALLLLIVVSSIFKIVVGVFNR